MFKRCGILTVVNFKFMIYDPVFYLYTRVEVYDLYNIRDGYNYGTGFAI